MLHYLFSRRDLKESTCALIIKSLPKEGRGLLLTVEVSLRQGKRLALMSKNTVLHTKCVRLEEEKERWRSQRTNVLFMDVVLGCSSSGSSSSVD